MESRSLISRLYRIKLLALGALLIVAGLLLTMLGDWLGTQNTPHLLTALVKALSDVLVVTGGVGIAVDYFTGKDKDAADTERARRVVKELTPEFTEAVVRGFAASPTDLKRVATPELLDEIATNALSLRLGDDQFAREIYADAAAGWLGLSKDQGIVGGVLAARVASLMTFSCSLIASATALGAEGPLVVTTSGQMLGLHGVWSLTFTLSAVTTLALASSWLRRATLYHATGRLRSSE